MPDLSTPLLDTVNMRLTDPNLACDTLAYDPSIVPATASIPTPALNTLVPTAPLLCPDGASGPRQHDGCTGKQHTFIFLFIRIVVRCLKLVGVSIQDIIIVSLVPQVILLYHAHRALYSTKGQCFVFIWRK